MKTNKTHTLAFVVIGTLFMTPICNVHASQDGALTEYERNLELYKNGFISRSELDESAQENAASTEYERNLELYMDGFISRSELDESAQENVTSTEYERNLELYMDGFISRSELDESAKKQDNIGQGHNQ